MAIVTVLLVGAVVALGCSDNSRAASDDAVTFQPSATQAPAPTAASGVEDTSTPASTPTERRVTLTPVGQINPGDDGFHGDIWEHKGFAYLGTWGSGSACPATGVKVVDLADPTQPHWVSTVAAIPGTSQEDIVVRSIETPAFTGDLLAVGIQSCAFTTPGGLALFDVTDPRNPVELGFFPTGARGVHELDLIQQGDRALALLAVPYSETTPGRGGDFRIVDVSDPGRPAQLSEWGADAGLSVDLTGGIGCRRSIYGHSARASADGNTAYLSYWDAGVIALDISDPTRPRVTGHLTYQPEEAGTTHSVAEADDGRLLLIADEEVVFGTPPGLSLEVQTAEGARVFHGCEARFSAPIDTAGAIESGLIDAGRACANDDLPDGVRGQVVIAHAGGCQPGDKAARLGAAGARAVIAGVPGEAVSEIGGGRASIPVVIVSEQDATTLRDIAAGAPARVTLPSARPWGALRIWDIDDLGNPRQLATYQTPNSLRFPAPDDGYYTVHNAEVVDDLAVASWWSDGVRVIDISDPTAPREVASYVPPAAPNSQGVIFPDRTMVWGVVVAGDLVLLSDVNSGLHVLRLGETDPSPGPTP
ncbi:MAG: LVIVD repeat-containing protein, partial [Dehalococcoidia bacterium]